MAWTAEQRAKGMATRLAKKQAKENKVASIKDASPEVVDKLLAEIADLKKQLNISEKTRTEVEEKALRSAEAQGALMQRAIEEIPTGKKIKVKRLNPKDPYKVVGHKEDGRDILRPNLVEVEIPTFFYKIDMPPCGGTDLKINGQPYYHGTVYELDQDTLATVKDMVFRTWKHDADIHGSDENFYRKPSNPTLSGAGMRR